MKRRILIVAIVALLVVSSLALVACGGDKADIYPKWIYENAWENEQAELEFAEGADVRIMSYNVLVEAWNSRLKTGINKPFNARAEQVTKTILHYSPDVVALQELDGNWVKALPKAMGEEYTFVKGLKGGLKRTSMMYNHNKVNLVDTGKVKYTNRSESTMRYVAWALFEKKDGGDKFIVMNTHFDFGKEKQDMQRSQMKEYGELAKKLETEYDVPVFMAGDYNAYESEVTDKESPIFEWWQGVELYKEFADMFKDSFVDSNFVESAVKMDGEHRAYDEPKWDKIFVSRNKVDVLKYVILSNDFYTSASDHFPIFIDAAI